MKMLLLAAVLGLSNIASAQMIACESSVTVKTSLHYGTFEKVKIDLSKGNQSTATVTISITDNDKKTVVVPLERPTADKVQIEIPITHHFWASEAKYLVVLNALNLMPEAIGYDWCPEIDFGYNCGSENLQYTFVKHPDCR